MKEGLEWENQVGRRKEEGVRREGRKGEAKRKKGTVSMGDRIKA